MLLEARVRAMYATYAPEKLDNVPMLLDKYGGALEKLIGALVEKYGPEPSAEARDDDDERAPAKRDDDGERAPAKRDDDGERVPAKRPRTDEPAERAASPPLRADPTCPPPMTTPRMPTPRRCCARASPARASCARRCSGARPRPARTRRASTSYLALEEVLCHGFAAGRGSNACGHQTVRALSRCATRPRLRRSARGSAAGGRAVADDAAVQRYVFPSSCRASPPRPRAPRGERARRREAAAARRARARRRAPAEVSQGALAALCATRCCSTSRRGAAASLGLERGARPAVLVGGAHAPHKIRAILEYVDEETRSPKSTRRRASRSRARARGAPAAGEGDARAADDEPLERDAPGSRPGGGRAGARGAEERPAWSLASSWAARAPAPARRRCAGTRRATRRSRCSRARPRRRARARRRRARARGRGAAVCGARGGRDDGRGAHVRVRRRGARARRRRRTRRVAAARPGARTGARALRAEAPRAARQARRRPRHRRGRSRARRERRARAASRASRAGSGASARTSAATRRRARAASRRRPGARRARSALPSSPGPLRELANELRVRDVTLAALEDIMLSYRGARTAAEEASALGTPDQPADFAPRPCAIDADFGARRVLADVPPVTRRALRAYTRRPPAVSGLSGIRRPRRPLTTMVGRHACPGG